MSCAVAVASSPAFSPSRISLFCKNASSPETLTLIGSPSSSSSSCSSPSSSSSFRLRCIQKQASGFRVCRKDAAAVVESAPSSSPAPLLKRKRPARIDIPSLPSLSFTPPSEGGLKEIEMESERYSFFCKKGRREVMEDRHAAIVDLDGDPKQAFFGVFDGHGGTRAAEFAAVNLGKNIMDEVMKRGSDGMEDAVKSGYVTTDAEFLKEDVRGGTCCATVLISNSDLVVSNAGDCRVVMSRGGVAEALTVDHRPSREDERNRIEALGGYVDCNRGVWRLQGSLAVCRGIGDSHLKKWVIAEPETKILRIKHDCEFLILASDGLWDKVSNQEAVDIARPFCTDADSPSLLSACKQLASLSLTRGSADDISVMIIQLGQFI
ncbi:probable protein phosphatase 2C 25 [Magnolia sinica]|uniref:probable protein phosphatase 2C 25 n=1 Tax=Magnolia sinica TaxID=86752 RepID=UPI00265928B0|nr:probable protein phosphatase 2C 25 [Magnolia sinica]XP_058075056.1 probable protein phosphatase 2C 25 [Magnolia sinica]